MKRFGNLILLSCLTAGSAFAQGHESNEDLLVWKWANFIVLVGGLGYLMYKNLPPLFTARTAAITKDMADSEKTRRDAETKAADVDRRLAAIEIEIAALHTQSKEDTAAEADRLAKHTAAEIARIQAQSTREIEDSGKTARQELTRYAAQLSVELAAQKIRSRMTPATEDRLVRGFVRDLK